MCPAIIFHVTRACHRLHCVEVAGGSSLGICSSLSIFEMVFNFSWRWLTNCGIYVLLHFWPTFWAWTWGGELIMISSLILRVETVTWFWSIFIIGDPISQPGRWWVFTWRYRPKPEPTSTLRDPSLPAAFFHLCDRYGTPQLPSAIDSLDRTLSGISPLILPPQVTLSGAEASGEIAFRFIGTCKAHPRGGGKPIYSQTMIPLIGKHTGKTTADDCLECTFYGCTNVVRRAIISSCQQM